MDLNITLKISAKLRGSINSKTEIEIFLEHLNKTICVYVPNSVTKEHILRLKALGKSSSSGEKGDLFIEFIDLDDTEVDKSKKHCNKCGVQLMNDAKFCSKCATPCENHVERNDIRKIIYEGEIHKCPSCGEIINSFTSNCPSCGYEIRGAKVVGSVKEFAVKINEIEASRETLKINPIKEMYFGRTITKTDEQKISLIRNYSIPNTKEDLFEFLILAKSNVQVELYDNEKIKSTDARLAISDAWKAKFEQAYEKAKIIFENDSRICEIQRLHDEMNNSIKKAKWKTWKLFAFMYAGLVGIGVMIIIISIVSYSILEKKEIARLEAIVEEIEKNIDNGEYKYALMYADSLQSNTNRMNDASERQWEIEREYWIDKIIEEAANNGVMLEKPEENK